MISAEIKRFVEGIALAMVASADAYGKPHLALGTGIKVIDGRHLLLENWYCQTTLRNFEQNPRLAIAVMAADMKIGYQFIGQLAYGFDAALLSGYLPEVEPAGEPQALTRLVVKVEEILAFCAGIDIDRPLG
jgi:uncharacterized protein